MRLIPLPRMEILMGYEFPQKSVRSQHIILSLTTKDSDLHITLVRKTLNDEELISLESEREEFPRVHSSTILFRDE